MEELVNKLANLQAEQKKIEDAADVASEWVDDQIETIEERLKMLKTQRDHVRRPFIDPIKVTIEQIVDVKQEIVDEWSSETMKKTIRFPVGDLSLRTTKSLDIQDGASLLASLIDHFSTNRIADEFISGFNLTSVKKFIDLHPQPPDVLELIPKTTVKLEIAK